HCFEVDREGKDSWRHARAGAETVAISSPGRVAVIKRVEREMTLAELAEAFFADRELVVAEGYFRSDHPRIEVHRSEAHGRPLCGRAEGEAPPLLAMVSDAAVDTECPLFGLDDAAGVAALVARRLLGRRERGMCS
ncbi:MAG: molybdopterin-guanine dinucleotide biosynthesis protein MobB, partial [Pseudodesulfovibrio sp.]